MIKQPIIQLHAKTSRLLIPNIIFAHTKTFPAAIQTKDITKPGEHTVTCPVARPVDLTRQYGYLIPDFRRAERTASCRLGFIPDRWFVLFYTKTGVTGPYLFGITMSNYLLSKEIYVLEHEYYTGLSIALVLYLATKRFGLQIGASLDKQVDEVKAELEKGRQDEIDMYENVIKKSKELQWRAEGQKILMDAKKECVAMQLETAYRARLMEVYYSVKGKMDYQIKKYSIERRLNQDLLVDWVVERVYESITPEFRKELLEQAIQDLTVSGPTYRCTPCVSDNISDYDWNVWCKFQPNGYDCTEGEPMQPKFYYDLKMEDCKTFTYGMCAQSKNHFETRSECRDRCMEDGLSETNANVSSKIYCRYQPDFGECNSYYPMFYYDITYRDCRGFSYSGCGGNVNRFKNAQICNAICGTVVEY